MYETQKEFNLSIDNHQGIELKIIVEIRDLFLGEQ